MNNLKTYYFKRNLLLSIFASLFFSSILVAQDISFSTVEPSAVTVCESAETFQIEFSNISGTTLSGVSIDVALPTGVEYVASSISESSSHNVQEQNISDLSNITLTVNDLSAGATVQFTINAQANFDAYTYQNSGGVFTNTITVNHNLGQDAETTSAYNVLYAALSITASSPQSTTTFVGGSYTRTVTIVNGGYGSLSTFYLEDLHDSNSSISGVDLGTLNGGGDQITFTGSDFTGIGNGDAFFDQNESLTVTETIYVSGCNDFQSTLTAYWGCGGQTTASNKKYPYTTVELYAPDLAVAVTPAFDYCIDGSADQQTLTITNNGTGPANTVTITISPEENDQYTRVDENSITMTVDAVTTSLTPSSTSDATAYDCLGSNPKDGFTVGLPTLQPGDVVTLDWDHYTCASTYCGDVNIVGWNYSIEYNDMCNTGLQTTTGDGQAPYSKGVDTFFESPSDLLDQQEGTYTLTLLSATVDLPEVAGSYLEVEYDVPLGLVWNGTVNDLDLSYTSGVTTWNPENVYFNSLTRKLTAQFAYPIPDNFQLKRSEFNVILQSDCSQGSITVNVGAQVYYVMDPSCNPSFRMPLTCYESSTTQFHCPGNCEHGLAFEYFKVTRTSLGISDNDLDGLPDATNNLDYNQIKLNRVMVSDTFETVFTGAVHTSATYPSWAYGYAQSTIPYGNYIDVVSAEVTVYDASTGQTLTCDQVSYSDALSSGNRVVDLDFSPATLALNCGSFSGFVFEDTDSISLKVSYRVASNPGAMAEEQTIDNSFYVTNVANTAGFQCNDWNGHFTLIGYDYKVNNSEQYNVKTCTKTIKQNYKMGIGSCCINYSGSNIFPYEYRNWAHIKKVEVDIPDGYTFVSGTIEQWRSKYTNNTKKESDDITPESIVGTIHTFNLENYLVENGGSINRADDGFNGRVSVEVKPECTVNEAANLPMSWTYTFEESAALGGSQVDKIASTADYLKYFHADLKLSTTLQTQDATGTTVDWTVKVKCNNADAENGWLYLNYSSSEMNIVSVKDVSADTMITAVNGLYYIGSMSINETRNYEVSVDYNTCSNSTLEVISGYNCDGYPSSYAAHTCGEQSLELYINPQQTELQVKFNGEFTGAGSCSDSLTVEFEMLSAKLSTVEDLYVEVVQPGSQSIEILPGAVEVLYPQAGSYSTITDPTLDQGAYMITGADMDPTIGTNGLVGITDVTANIVKLRIGLILKENFKPGDFVRFNIGGKEPCGADLSELSLMVDPNAIFEELTNVGLSDEGDDWGTAWGDYDNDGFVDLFVVDNRVDYPNRLYKNDGDGTFTKVTTGAIATDQALSTGATWGDYNNDGYLDLYVANSIGSANFLYRNNGDGTFTKIANDPIVSYTGYSHGPAWADYDNDGFLDMFVADYFSTKFNKLYHNNGDGTFEAVTTASITLENSSSISGVWGDYNNDGLIDLFIANLEHENNSLYKNLGNGNFEKITSGDIVNDGGYSVGASWGDYNNDGYLDLFVANAANQNNFLYTNNGNGTFTKVTSGDIVNDAGHTHGSAWGDFDNDGDLDLFAGNDAGQHNFLYSNNGDGTFTKLTNSITEAQGYSFGASWADIDNDLDLDLIVANRAVNQNDAYLNERGECQGKVCVVLEGSNSNKAAIGAKVKVKANIYGQDVWQLREVSSQTGGGTSGQNDMKNIFGLGDATTVDSIIVEWPSGYVQRLANQSINNCILIVEDAGGKICGVAYHDANNNCVQDAGEIGLANMEITIQPGDHVVTTNDTGAYVIYVEPDTYTVAPNADAQWAQDCTVSHSVTVVSMGQEYCGYDFAYSPINPEADLGVEITNTPHRIGEENLVAVTYTNNGTEATTNTVLTFTHDSYIDILDSSIPYESYANDTITWNVGTLEIGESVTIYLTSLVDAATPIGTMITMEASISSDQTETIIVNNQDSSSEEAVGSFDPNDIAVTPEGKITSDEELVYRIRFQNVGNASAATVRVVDQLPEHLDMTTLELGVVSHAYRFEVQDDRTLVWTFDNINLPDSTTNEVESHGYVYFKIKPKADLEEGTDIYNFADIFFDANEAIRTNTVINTIQNEAEETTGLLEKSLMIYPNPAMNTTSLQIVDELEIPIIMRSIDVYNMTGNQVMHLPDVNAESVLFERKNLAAGTYLIRVVGEDMNVYTEVLILQ